MEGREREKREGAYPRRAREHRQPVLLVRVVDVDVGVHRAGRVHTQSVVLDVIEAVSARVRQRGSTAISPQPNPHPNQTKSARKNSQRDKQRNDIKLPKYGLKKERPVGAGRGEVGDERDGGAGARGERGLPDEDVDAAEHL